MSLPTCRICGHVHDPEDGRCDAHARIGLGPCPCPGEPILGVAGALVDAFERGQKLSYTGHLIVTDPDTPATVQMVLDEDDYAALRLAATNRAGESANPRTVGRYFDFPDNVLCEYGCLPGEPCRAMPCAALGEIQRSSVREQQTGRAEPSGGQDGE